MSGLATGLDLVEVARFDRLLERTPDFALRYFTAAERARCAASARPAQEFALRFAVKEALLKAAGLGLGMQPAHIPTGRFGQRAGLWQGPLGTFGWRSIACSGHWLCVALAGHVPPMQMTVLRQSPHVLLRRLADVPPQS